MNYKRGSQFRFLLFFTNLRTCFSMNGSWEKRRNFSPHPVVSSWHTIVFVKTRLLASTKIAWVFSSTVAFLVALRWWRGAEFHSGRRLHAVVHAVFTNTCIRVAVSLMMSPNFVNNSSIIYTMLSIIYWVKDHPVSNSIIIGFERPVLMIDVRQSENPTW